MFLGLPGPHPDPLVRGTDPRIRIRIRTKMSRIRNNAFWEEAYPTPGTSTSTRMLHSDGYHLSGRDVVLYTSVQVLWRGHVAIWFTYSWRIYLFGK
jgi:hypothetical protein